MIKSKGGKSMAKVCVIKALTASVKHQASLLLWKLQEPATLLQQQHALFTMTIVISIASSSASSRGFSREESALAQPAIFNHCEQALSAILAKTPY